MVKTSVIVDHLMMLQMVINVTNALPITAPLDTVIMTQSVTFRKLDFWCVVYHLILYFC